MTESFAKGGKQLPVIGELQRQTGDIY